MIADRLTYDSSMVTPRKRPNSRSQNRASQRYTPPSIEGAEPDMRQSIPRPPSSCQPWHFYWCDGHNDWHHHDEFIVTAHRHRAINGSRQPGLEQLQELGAKIAFIPLPLGELACSAVNSVGASREFAAPPNSSRPSSSRVSALLVKMTGSS